MHSIACARCSTGMWRHAPVGVLLHSCTCARIDALHARMHTGAPRPTWRCAHLCATTSRACIRAVLGDFFAQPRMPCSHRSRPPA